MLEALPPVHEILGDAATRNLAGQIADPYRTRLVRKAITRFRERLRKEPGAWGDRDALREAIVRAVVEDARMLGLPYPRRVINGTGILIHTNLGRAPLGDALTSDDLLSLLAGYSNLEWNASSGKRGDRDQHLSSLLELVTGGDSALVVNNGAGALVLALETLARGRPVIVSRSELVEIGGGFRVPEIMESSGCELVEVGTTNRTRLGDYERRVSRRGAAVILKVHQSNFVQRGFVESVSLKELARLARKARVPLVYDNGSGLVTASPLPFLSSEPSIEDGLKAGAGVVISSGDKLLGSVQAGLIVGQASLVRRMRRNPLYRALRIDKVRLGLLSATLGRYLQGRSDEVPLWKMAGLDCDALGKRARGKLRLPSGTSRWKTLEWVGVQASMGGGSNPEEGFPSVGLELVHKDHSAEGLRSLLGARDVPIAGYIRKGALILDMRTLFDSDFPEVQQAIDALS